MRLCECLDGFFAERFDDCMIHSWGIENRADLFARPHPWLYVHSMFKHGPNAAVWSKCSPAIPVVHLMFSRIASPDIALH